MSIDDTMKKCIGIWETEGKCQNVVDTRCHPILCKNCNEIRIKHLNKQFEELEQQMNKKSKVI